MAPPSTTPLKAILFDLGGVILHIDYDLTAAAFEKHFGIVGFASRLFSQGSQTQFVDAFERGQISAQQFVSELRSCAAFDSDERARLSSASASATEAIEACWNAMLLDMPNERVAYLRTLKERGLRLYLLSNINATHEAEVDRIIERDVKGGVKAFRDCFDYIYYSHHIGRRKPDPDTFEWVLSDIANRDGLAKDEVVFFDDSIQHITGAKSVGLRSYLVPKEHNLVDVVDPVLNSEHQ
ncbi:HAD-like protein [Rhizoclosmatium globosum]|uniref:HAD-like protein n=1 Tax=Rhizoclosmatium globosum TaxID=329046 RepID=A0A1Y2C8Z4_9FUNG|nr:HAD-like protein [Rhizoclosmatium globosum]|eukprot:ORY43334.1 HAD-like protein [Rhizoclosmatium globosum]